MNEGVPCVRCQGSLSLNRGYFTESKLKFKTTTQAFFGQCYELNDTVHNSLDLPKNPFTTTTITISCSFDRYLHAHTPPLH